MSDTERKPHKWQNEIIRWANGEQIQCRRHCRAEWEDFTSPCNTPQFQNDVWEWRAKPEPVHLYGNARFHKTGSGMEYVRCNASAKHSNLDNIRFTVADGEVTAVELIK